MAQSPSSKKSKGPSGFRTLMIVFGVLLVIGLAVLVLGLALGPQPAATHAAPFSSAQQI